VDPWTGCHVVAICHFSPFYHSEMCGVGLQGLRRVPNWHFYCTTTAAELEMRGFVGIRQGAIVGYGDANPCCC